MKFSILKRAGLLAGVAAMGLAGLAGAQTASVDGVGGVATADPVFTTTFTTVDAALAAIKANGTVNVDGGSATISIIAGNATAEAVAAGLLLDTNCALTIDGNVTGSTYGGELASLRITPGNIALGPASAAIVIVNRTGNPVTLRDLVVTPANGAAGPQNSRMVQSYNAVAGTVSTTTFERVIFTALIDTNADTICDTPVLNPFTHAVGNTLAARLAGLRVFDGGGANNAIELRNNATPTAGAMMTYNFNECYITHVHAAAAANKGGGIAVSRTAEVTVNLNAGTVISYNSGSGIRGVGTLATATTAFNVNGTAAKPVFFLYNGWLEDSANTARNEHIQNGGSPVTVNYAYFVGSFQEAIELQAGGADSISNSYFALPQSNLDAGTAGPDVASAAGIYLNSTSAGANVTLTNCTFFDNQAPTGTNQRFIYWNAPAVGVTLNTSNVVFAGINDRFGHIGTNAVTWNDDDGAFATAGAHALNAPYVIAGTGLTRTNTDTVEADPDFASTTFAPTFSTVFAAPGNLSSYLSVRSAAHKSTSTRLNPVAAINVTGANAASPLPVELSRFSLD